MTTLKTNWRNWAAHHWAWVFLIIGIVFFAAEYVPRYFLSAADTETTMLAVFYHDTIEQHHSFADWKWGGCSDIFPDVSCTFLFNYLTRDGWTALVLLSIFYFLSWLGASYGLGVVLKRPNRLSLLTILFLFWVAQICDYSLPYEFGLHMINALFASMYHSGSGLLCLVCLVILLRQISAGLGSGYWWLFIMVFLGGASDILFIVVFICPALAVVGVLAVAFWQERMKYFWLGLNIALAGVSSYYLAPYLFPVDLGTGQYLHLSWQSACVTFPVVLGEMARPEHHFFAFMGIMDVLTVLAGIGGVLFYCFSSRRKLISPVVLALMVFCSTAIVLDWLAVLLLGVFTGMYADRYLTVALLIPQFIGVFVLHAAIQWRPWSEKLFVMVAVLFATCISFIPQVPYPDYESVETDIPFLKAVMKERNLKIGVADYWRANLTTFLSHWEIKFVPTTGDGDVYTWFSSIRWFGKGLPVKERPSFRLYYLPYPGIRAKYGPPDEVLHAPVTNDEIWIYSEANALHYNEHFGILSNKLADGGITMKIAPSTLPSGTGTVQGQSRIATDGHDQEAFLNGGPYIPLTPGHYRMTMHYTFLLPPAPGKFPVYDLLSHSPTDPDVEMDTAPLTNQGKGPQSFSRDFVVSKPDHSFEMRIFYHGSGTISFDGLDITSLDP